MWFSGTLRKSLLIILAVIVWLCGILPRQEAHAICIASAPYAPQPIDQAEMLDAQVMLYWQVDCAVSVEVRLNGALVATLDAATTTYKIEAQAGATTWQVIAIDAAGNRAPGPLWHFQRDTGGWLATPQPISTEMVIYTPPAAPRILIDLNSPSVLLSMLCSSLCGGLGLVVVAAWMLGVRAQRRDHQRRWYK